MYSWLTHCCSLTYVYFVKSLVMLLLCCYFSLYHCIWLYENKDIYIQYTRTCIIITDGIYIHPHNKLWFSEKELILNQRTKSLSVSIKIRHFLNTFLKITVIPPDFFLKCFRYLVNSLYPSGNFKISNLSMFVSIHIKIS